MSIELWKKCTVNSGDFIGNLAIVPVFLKVPALGAENLNFHERKKKVSEKPDNVNSV